MKAEQQASPILDALVGAGLDPNAVGASRAVRHGIKRIDQISRGIEPLHASTPAPPVLYRSKGAENQRHPLQQARAAALRLAIHLEALDRLAADWKGNEVNAARKALQVIEVNMDGIPAGTFVRQFIAGPLNDSILVGEPRPSSGRPETIAFEAFVREFAIIWRSCSRAVDLNNPPEEFVRAVHVAQRALPESMRVRSHKSIEGKIRRASLGRNSTKLSY